MNPLDDTSQNRNETVAAYVVGELTGEERAAFERRLVDDEALRREVVATRAALNDARAWLDEPPPGIERAEGLRIPAMGDASGVNRTPSTSGLGVPPKIAASSAPSPSPRRSRVIPLYPVVRRIAAVAAIFVLGFGFGRAVDWGRSGAATPPRPGAVGVAAQSDRSDRSDQSKQTAVVSRPDQSNHAGQTTVQPQPAESPRPAAAPHPAAPRQTAPPSATYVGRVLAQAGAPRPITYSENGKLFVQTTLSGSGASALWVVDGRFRLDHGPNSP